MLDLHNHVLFGLDDGCRTPEESAALCMRAKAAGHSGLVATPHIRAGMFPNTPELIRARRDQTQPLILGSGLELFLGAEYYFDESLLAAARARSLLTLGERSRYVLVELPSGSLPPRWANVLFEIRVQGYRVVIAHPERCRGVQADLPNALEALRAAGALLQLDLGSLLGSYGQGARGAAQDLLRRGAYHVAAGDLHRPEDVEAIIPKAKQELAALLKKRKLEQGVELLTALNPRRIVADEEADAIPAV